LGERESRGFFNEFKLCWAVAAGLMQTGETKRVNESDTIGKGTRQTDRQLATLGPRGKSVF